jgi:hypothetical protein
MRQHHKRGSESPGIPQFEAKDAGASLLGIVKFGSMCGSVFFTEGAGRWYYRYAIVSLIGMLAFIEYAPPLLVFIPVWLLFLIGKRINKSWHSQSRGPSRLRHLFRSERLALVMEPIVVFGFGVACAPYSEPFAEFCVFVAICMFIELAVQVHQIDMDRQAMGDAEAHLQYMNRLRRGGPW